MVIKLWIVQADMNPRYEGFVKITNAICGQEQYAVVVLQHTEEHYFGTELAYIWRSLGDALPETKPFRVKSCGVLSAKKTSASSRRRIQPQRLASAKVVFIAFSTSCAVVPRSPEN